MRTVDILKEMKETTIDPAAEVSSILEAISGEERELITGAGFFRNIVARPSTFEKAKGKVYHIDEIRKICMKYDFKLLSPKEYKGEIHPLLGSNLKAFRDNRRTKVDVSYSGEVRYKDNYCSSNLCLLAPRELFEVKLDYDPILMYQISGEHFEVVDRWGRDITSYRRFVAISRLFTMTGMRASFKKPFWPLFLTSLIWIAIGAAVTGLNCIWAKWLLSPIPFTELSLAIAFLIVWPICEFFNRKSDFKLSNSELQNA